MAKRITPDPHQMTFDFNFDEKVDAYVSAKQEILEAMEVKPKPSQPVENEFEACVEIAVAIKQAIRTTKMSRDQVVDAINAYFGRTDEGAATEPPSCRKPLTIHMFNNYLSKPIEYPVPTYYLYAIHHVTGSLLPAEAIVSVEGAKVATGMEIRHMTLGKLDQSITEMQRLKKELKKG